MLMRRSKLMRYFPVGAKEAVHVPLAVLEDLTPETKIEVMIGAPEGVHASVVLDIKFMEIG